MNSHRRTRCTKPSTQCVVYYKRKNIQCHCNCNQIIIHYKMKGMNKPPSQLNFMSFFMENKCNYTWKILDFEFQSNMYLNVSFQHQLVGFNNYKNIN